MPIERPRLKYTLEEILGFQPVPQREETVPRTNDLGNAMSPNWDSKVKRFSLGVQNAKESTLSNLITEKMQPFGVSDFLQYLDTNNMRMFDRIILIVEHLVNSILSLLKDKK